MQNKGKASLRNEKKKKKMSPKSTQASCTNIVFRLEHEEDISRYSPAHPYTSNKAQTLQDQSSAFTAQRKEFHGGTILER